MTYERHRYVQRRPSAGGVSADQLDITASGQLYHYWPMDSLTTSTPNIIRPTFPLEIVNAPVLTSPGMISNAIDFEFDSSQYAAAALPDQGPQTGLTICLWIRRESQHAFSQLVNKKSVNSPSAFYSQFFLVNAVPASRIFTDSANYIERSDLSDPVITGTWTHLVTTWDGGTVATSIKIYRDAVQHDDSSGGSGTFTGPYTGSDLKWTVGAQFENQTTPTASEFFDGAIDDVRIYNRELSASEILSIFRAGQNRRP